MHTVTEEIHDLSAPPVNKPGHQMQMYYLPINLPDLCSTKLLTNTTIDYQLIKSNL